MTKKVDLKSWRQWRVTNKRREMKDYQLQTPDKGTQLTNRRSKVDSHRPKQPQKSSKKCLDYVFNEDALLESPMDSTEFLHSPDTCNELGDSAESFVASPDSFIPPSLNNVLTSADSSESCITSPDPFISPSSNTGLTPLFSTVTADTYQKASETINHVNYTVSKNCVDIASVEAEMIVHHLKEARIQVMSSTDSDLLTKKLLDALINAVIGELIALSEEKDQFVELVSSKTRVVFMSFFLWILVVCMVLVYNFRVPRSFNEPPPT